MFFKIRGLVCIFSIFNMDIVKEVIRLGKVVNRNVSGKNEFFVFFWKLERIYMIFFFYGKRGVENIMLYL